MTATGTLAAVVEAAIGRPLDQLTITEALDVADRPRAIVAALPPATPADAHHAAQAADLIESRAGTASPTA